MQGYSIPTDPHYMLYALHQVKLVCFHGFIGQTDQPFSHLFEIFITWGVFTENQPTPSVLQLGEPELDGGGEHTLTGKLLSWCGEICFVCLQETIWAGIFQGANFQGFRESPTLRRNPNISI